MRRKLLILAWASCVLVTSAVGAVWIRSYFARDQVSWWSVADSADRSGWSQRSVMFGRGQFRADYRSRLDTGSWTAILGQMNAASGVTPGLKYEATEPYPTYAHIDGPPVDFERWGFVFDYQHEITPGPSGDGETRWL